MNTQATATWHLKHAPAYTHGGRLAAAPYPCGPLLLSMSDNTASQGEMQVVSDATQADLTSYVKDLLQSGLQCTRDTITEQNRFLAFKGPEARVLVSYFAVEKRLTVTEDRTPYTAQMLSDPIATDGRCEFFVYGLNMDPGGHDHRDAPHLDSALNTSGHPNCGMLLAITTGDGRVIVVDGGFTVQLEKVSAVNELDRFLHRITGKSEDEPVTIAAWYLSHNHNDHLQGFLYLLKTFPDRYRLERIVTNVPDTTLFKSMNCTGLTELSALLKTQSPACREVKLHTGERITLGGVTLEALYTHEDAANTETGGTRVRDFNDTCTVVKATLGTKKPLTVMILGDISDIGEEKMTLAYTKKTMHCDVVQQAHHAFNSVPELYRLIAAPVMCFIQSEQGTVKNEMIAGWTAGAKKYSKKFYYNGDVTKTVGFAKVRGRVREVYRFRSYLK